MDLARICIVLGVVFLLIGGGLMLLPKGVNPFAWFGRLPGDISYKSDHTVVFAPLMSMLVISIALSVVGWLVRRFLS
jgi:hypothetical protein